MAAPAAASPKRSLSKRGSKATTTAAGGAAKPPRRKSCENTSCPKQPAFSYNGSGVRFCAEHRLEGMVNVRNRRCEGHGCTKEPYFGDTGGKARFCATHKPDDNMVDVRHRRCDFDACTKQPNYGYEGQRAKYCSTHKLPTMVDVKHRRCAETGCRLYSSYAFPRSKQKFCLEHRRDGMVPSGRGRFPTDVVKSTPRNNRTSSGTASCTTTQSPAASTNPTTESAAPAATVGKVRRPSPRSAETAVEEPNRRDGGGRGTKNPADGEHDDYASMRLPKRRGSSTGSPQRTCSSEDKSVAATTSVDDGEDSCRLYCDDHADRPDLNWRVRESDEWAYRRRSCPADLGAATAMIAATTQQQRLQYTSAPPASQSLSSSPVSRERHRILLRRPETELPMSLLPAAASWSTSPSVQRSTAARTSSNDRVQHMRMPYRMPTPVKSTSSSTLSREADAPHGANGAGLDRKDLNAKTGGGGLRRNLHGHYRGSSSPLLSRSPECVAARRSESNGGSCGAGERYEPSAGRSGLSRHYDVWTSSSCSCGGTARGKFSSTGSCGAESCSDVASGTGGSSGAISGGPRVTRDVGGGFYPAARSRPFSVGNSGAGGGQNRGYAGQGMLRDDEAERMAEAELSAPGGGGGGLGTWAEDAITSWQLPNMESLTVSASPPLYARRSVRNGGGGIGLMSSSLPSMGQWPPSASMVKSCRPLLPGCTAGSDRGEDGSRWRFSLGLRPSTQEPWPSPPFVHGDFPVRRGVGATVEDNDGSRREGGEGSPKRSAPGDPGDDGRPSSGRWLLGVPSTAGGLGQKDNDDDGSVFTLNNRNKKRLVKYDRDSGTLETLEMPNYRSALRRPSSVDPTRSA